MSEEHKGGGWSVEYEVDRFRDSINFTVSVRGQDGFIGTYYRRGLIAGNFFEVGFLPYDGSAEWEHASEAVFTLHAIADAIDWVHTIGMETWKE